MLAHDTGKHDWLELYRLDPASLLSEKPFAELPPVLPVVKCGGPCEVRKLPKRGRGLVLLEDVFEGQVVLVSRAFELGHTDGFLKATVAKLRSCPQAVHDRFFCLQDGPQSGHLSLPVFAEGCRESHSESIRIHNRNVDAARVKRILDTNSHSRAAITLTGHSDDIGLLGLWIEASFMNHSCCPNVQRTFVGDLMIFRAVRPLKAGTELLNYYCTLAQPMHLRREYLRDTYGFTCECARCVCEKAFLPIVESKALLERGMKLCQAQGSPRKTADSLDVLASDVETVVRRNLEEGPAKLARNQELQTACYDLLGLTTKLKDLVPESLFRLEPILCGSFAQVSMSATYAWEQLQDTGRFLGSCGRCCLQLQGVYTHNVVLANFASRYAAQMFRKCHEVQQVPDDVRKAAQYARTCHECCYGDTLWSLQAKKLGWPLLLIAASARTSSIKPSRGSVAHALPCERKTAGAIIPDLQFDYSFSQTLDVLKLSIFLPLEIEVHDINLDISECCVVISLVNSPTTSSLCDIHLSHAIDPVHAAPARFVKRSRNLKLELPLMSYQSAV